MNMVKIKDYISISLLLCRYNLMMGCWSKEPTERPNFQYLEETLSKLRDYEADKRANQNGADGHVNQAYQEDGMIFFYQYRHQYNQNISFISSYKTE